MQSLLTMRVSSVALVLSIGRATAFLTVDPMADNEAQKLELRTQDNSTAVTPAEISEVKITLGICPELFGGPRKDCDECGGDFPIHGTCRDRLVSGLQTDKECLISGEGCDGFRCKCTHTKRPQKPQVTSTAVVDGQTGTIVFEPVTLDEYLGLRASATVTVTGIPVYSENTYAASETGKMEAVVFAGGSTWWTVNQTGVPAALAAIKLPNEKPEGSKDDDKSCYPVPQCKDCSGSNNRIWLCYSGALAGCPCEKSTSGDKPNTLPTSVVKSPTTAMPKLPRASSPSGSTCVSTGTIKECHYLDERTQIPVCGSTVSCYSWAPTSTLETSPQPSSPNAALETARPRAPPPEIINCIAGKHSDCEPHVECDPDMKPACLADADGFTYLCGCDFK